MALVSIELPTRFEFKFNLHRRNFVGRMASRWKVYALCALRISSSPLLRVTGVLSVNRRNCF